MDLKDQIVELTTEINELESKANEINDEADRLDEARDKLIMKMLVEDKVFQDTSWNIDYYSSGVSIFYPSSARIPRPLGRG